MKTCRRKWLARWLAACIAVVLGMGMCAGLPVSAAYENTYTNTGNQRADIVAVAKTQIGYHEGSLEGTTNSSNNYTKYNVWNGKIEGGYRYAWCHAFVSWCANQAGIGTDIVPKTAGTSTGRSFFVNQGTYRQSAANGGSYVPQAGDIIYYGSGSSPSHVGIVSDCDGSTVYTIEGNYSNKVGTRAINLSNSYIIGYGVPNYKGVNPNPNPPTNLSITSNDGKYKVGDTVTFTFSCSNATEMYIPIDVNGERKYFIDVSGRSSYTCSFDTPGVYGYFLYAKNAAGEASTVLDYKQFRVDSSVPANLTISTDKNSYAVGEQITFSFSCDNAVRVAIPVDYNGKRTDFIDVTGKNTYTCSFDKAGIYGYFLYAENACGESTTEYIEFTVQDNPPSNLSISTDKSYYVIGETITFSFTSQNATRLAIPIDYNGKRVDFIDVTGKDTYTCSFDKAGIYGYFLYAENACGESSTVLDYKQIQVYDTIPGDLNSDNTLTTADAVLLQRYLLQERTLTQSQWQTADLNADGTVNGFDLALLRQKLVG